MNLIDEIYAPIYEEYQRGLASIDLNASDSGYQRYTVIRKANQQFLRAVRPIVPSFLYRNWVREWRDVFMPQFRVDAIFKAEGTEEKTIVHNLCTLFHYDGYGAFKERMKLYGVYLTAHNILFMRNVPRLLRGESIITEKQKMIKGPTNFKDFIIYPKFGRHARRPHIVEWTPECIQMFNTIRNLI